MAAESTNPGGVEAQLRLLAYREPQEWLSSADDL